MKAYVVCEDYPREMLMLDFIHVFTYHQFCVSLTDWCVLLIVGGISTVAGLGKCERPEWLAHYHQTIGKSAKE
jgi:hypothetical protein